ncbi:4a-hydroxytetrahydrobiopterin dehydratase [Streptomyces sp. J2-1]|uniref:4a-hydroxytetrahydrobiopterin dehydratase n=1 Tax=Streptomyces corallincola TaxID=2851888 RepID=UPI001C38B430|nr:4a-hydroxytetrahydrobiopterin dehydratase [Streptomyces corallincola]MBV2355483.1 4a-hydroxytetrahydrobiopterin dehydratase [Streptomyces corallincola]
MADAPLAPEEIADLLAALPGWTVEEGRLTRAYRAASHRAAAALVAHVAVIQDELDHHGDLTLSYDTVRLSVHTHSAGGALTARDFALARRVADIAPAHLPH